MGGHGRHLEQSVHSYGCRRWFNLERDTVTYRISAIYKPGESPPGDCVSQSLRSPAGGRIDRLTTVQLTSMARAM